MGIVLSLHCKHTGWKILAADWKIILLHLYTMGSWVHPLYISNLYCWTPEEQVKLDVFFSEVSWHRPGRKRALNAADKWSVYLGTSHASTTTFQLLSFPPIVDLLLPSAASPLLGTHFFLSLSFFFFTLCCFTILLWSGSDTLLVNQHRPYHLNKEVGWVQHMEPEQWMPLCVLFFFLLENSLKLSVTVDNDPMKTISHSYTLPFAGKYVFLVC